MRRPSDHVWRTRWRSARYRHPRRRDVRDEFEKDRARTLHSACFRRLQSKTQILSIAEGDFHRTRLTHTMEVASISLSIHKEVSTRLAKGERFGLPKADLVSFREAFPTEALLEAIAFCHDLGHPPFGHSGEEMLDRLMRPYGGFEGNGQSLRIATRHHLEGTARYGLELTRRTMLGFLKYPVVYSKVCKTKVRNKNVDKPPKCYLDSEADVVEWILRPLNPRDRRRFQEPEWRAREHGKPKHKSFDASIMDLADDISYAVHDIEDGIYRELVSQANWNRTYRKYAKRVGAAWWREHADNLGSSRALSKNLFIESRDTRKRALGGIINALVRSVKVEARPFEEPLLRYKLVLGREAAAYLEFLKKVTRRFIHKSDIVRSRELLGNVVLRALFDAIGKLDRREAGCRLSKPFADEYGKRNKDDRHRRRVICDYIASMTDAQAIEEYKRLFAS
jgi:dGTPase